jgi:hypothetical protein
MEMVERVLVKEMGFVEEEDGMEAIAAQLFDVLTDGIKDCRGGGRGAQAERDTELAIEIATAERRVMTISQAIIRGRQTATQCSEDAGFPDAGITDEKDGGALREGVEKLLDDGGLRRREPEVGVGDLF